MELFVSQIDDHRDRLFCTRLERLLQEIGQGDHLLPFGGGASGAMELREETRQALSRADAILCLYSPEAAASRRVQLELHLASTLTRPGCLLLFPGVRVPRWATEAVQLIPLEGFKDSGPGLPPGTDEWEILRESTFVRTTLRAVTDFIARVRSGSAPNLPAIPPPDPAGG